MKYKSLQIKLLSKSGELLNCITCYAGQVSVFRAYSPAELKPYQRALAGLPGPERFSIILDDTPFVPEEHIFIGFGERFGAGESDLTVNDFLLNSGVPQNAVFSLLVSYSMENFAAAKCSSLPSCEERRLRLLAATYSTDKVVILNDPFEPISAHWRERFAELLVSYARSKEQIVIVTSLTYRPDIWIDNEYIDRIQVGENIQKTIGFGSSRSSMNALIDQVRATIKQEKLAGPGGPPPKRPNAARHGPEPGKTPGQEPESDLIQPWSSEPFSRVASKAALPESEPAGIQAGAPPDRTQRWAAALFAAIGILAVCFGIVFGRHVFYRPAKTSGPEKLASLQPTAAADTQQQSSDVTQVEFSQAPNLTNMTETAAPQTEETTKESVSPAPSPAQMAANMFVLDNYPPEIRHAVLESFEGYLSGQPQARTAGELKAPRVSSEQAQRVESMPLKQPSRVERSKTAADLLNVLQSTSGSGETLPDQIRPSGDGYTNLSPEEMAKLSPEQRREIIRQKFLEAIQRAAQQKQ